MNCRTAHIITYGCQMNEHDSEIIAAILQNKGFQLSQDEEDADIIILNTCAVRAKPEKHAINKLKYLGSKKRSNSKLGVCGCAAKTQLLDEFDFLDFVVNPGNIHALPDVIDKVFRGERVSCTQDDQGIFRDGNFARLRKSKFKAWVKVTEGCSNYCSYCIVPYVRGNLRSRPLLSIVDELKELQDSSFIEVTLLGQDVTAYNADGKDFVYLLHIVSKFHIPRIRFLTSHPKRIKDALLWLMREQDNLCKYLHLPLQSGSDRILRLMNRGYSSGYFRDLVYKAREVLDDCAITTDVMVGFPGESTADFEQTYNLLSQLRLDGAYTFIYSPREGTKAAKDMKNLPTYAEQRARLQKLVDLQKQITKENNARFIGTVQEVLVTCVNPRIAGTLQGRTRQDKVVIFRGSEELIGKLCYVNIHKASTYYLEGEIVTE